MTKTLPWISLAVILAVAGCGGGNAEQSGGANDQGTQSSQSTQSGNTSNSGGTAGGEEPAFPMPLPTFLGAVTAEVLPELCQETSPLRTCYPTIDENGCARGFAAAMMACGENMQDSLPAQVDEQSADPVATAVATCARMAYQLGLEQAGFARAADCPLAR